MTDVEQVALFQQGIDMNNDEERENGVSKGSGRRSRRAKEQLTSKQQLNSTIKSVRDLLRKDAGLSGDTDRLPQLTWLLFLKHFDDFEYAQEEELGDAYEPIIEAPYRWRDWAAVEDRTQRLTGDERCCHGTWWRIRSCSANTFQAGFLLIRRDQIGYLIL